MKSKKACRGIRYATSHSTASSKLQLRVSNISSPLSGVNGYKYHIRDETDCQPKENLQGFEIRNKRFYHKRKVESERPNFS